MSDGYLTFDWGRVYIRLLTRMVLLLNHLSVSAPKADSPYLIVSWSAGSGFGGTCYSARGMA
jgi:hypothetical protein